MLASLGYAIRVALVATTLAAAGCGSICNGQNVCAVTGSGDDIQVCDGGDFRGCGDGNRGQVIQCAQDFRRAVCTTNGWTFEGQ
jgi:hypothetical protein